MHTKSQNELIFEKLCEVIPGGVNSPVRSCKEMGQIPLVATSAKGDMIYDADGTGYIDFCCSWGPLIHGHAHPEILSAVSKRIALGTSFGVTTPIEEALARKIAKLIPSIEKIRFVSSGTEATMTAARLARGFTRRDAIVKFSGNFHGHSDIFLVQAGSGMFGRNHTSTSAGIPTDIIKHTICLPYNEIENNRKYLEQEGEKIAAVIVEPVAGNMGLVKGDPNFLKMLREVTTKMGIVLIFDEVISGFRVGLQGAQGYYQIQPDLTCLGKIIGGGFPAAACGGRKEIMDFLAPLGDVYQGGTLSGNPVAMEAGLQSIHLLERAGFYEELTRKTDLLTKPIQAHFEKNHIPACVQQLGSLFTIFFGLKVVNNMEEAKKLDTQKFAHFFRYLFSKGIYFPPSQYEACFVSAAHTDEHLKYTCETILEYFS